MSTFFTKYTFRLIWDYILEVKPEQMHDEGVFGEYAKIIYIYNVSSNRRIYALCWNVGICRYAHKLD